MTLQSQNKKRISYAIVFIVLLLVEVGIAVYVHDSFVRPYIGDVLVVVLLYTAVRVVIPEKCKLLPLYVFVFAAIVEGLQYFDLLQMLGLENMTFLRIVVGSVFDVKDIICYGVGCVFLGAYEWILFHVKK